VRSNRSTYLFLVVNWAFLLVYGTKYKLCNSRSLLVSCHVTWAEFFGIG
jgi:hypothetical protein